MGSRYSPYKFTNIEILTEVEIFIRHVKEFNHVLLVLTKDTILLDI
jgi:hypothetical protein